MISISLNGHKEEIVSGISINKYLADRSINPAHVVVEINKIILPKEQTQTTVCLKPLYASKVSKIKIRLRVKT